MKEFDDLHKTLYDKSTETIQEIHAIHFENPDESEVISFQAGLDFPEVSSLTNASGSVGKEPKVSFNCSPLGVEMSTQNRAPDGVNPDSNIPVGTFSAAEVYKAPKGENYDMRPHVYDGVTKSLVLWDTGSQVTAYPPDPGDAVDPSLSLKAVNGSVLKCYGYKEVEIQINRKVYQMRAIKTDVRTPILGWDFNKRYKLATDWNEWGDAVLIDKRANITHIFKYKAVPHSDPQKLHTIEEPVGVSSSNFSSTFGQQPSKGSHSLVFDVASVEALEEELDVVINNLETMPESEYKELVKKYPDLLELNFSTETPKNGIIHRIDTAGHAPCKAKVRKLLPGSHKAIEGEKAIKQLLKLGIIEEVDPSKPNNWSSALHLPSKPDGSLRPVGDYRLLNAKTVLDLYPLPNLRSFTAKIAGSNIFSKVDMAKAFHQIVIDPRDRHKTCITTPWGLFNFRRLSMGMQNSAQSFQRLVDSILKDTPNIFVYLDDILIFNKNKEEHLRTIEEVFRKLSAAGLTLSLSKCEFGKTSLDYLGYSVSREGIKPIAKKVAAIQDFPEPSKQKQLLGFLGALNYYRASLPSLPPTDPKSKDRTPAEILEPLYKIATAEIPRNKFPEIWKHSKACRQAFQDAKLLLQRAITLNFPDPRAPLALTTDASKVAMGATLDQWVDGSWRPLGMWSKSFKPQQRTYSTFRRELMAIQYSMRHFNSEFRGRHLIVFSDHRPILGCFKAENPQPHDAIAVNAINEISQWTSDIRFKAGKEIVVADWLSRPPDCPIGTAYESEPNLQTKNEKIEYVPMEATLAALEEVALHVLSPKAIAEDQHLDPQVVAHKAGQMPRNVHMGTVRLADEELYCEISDPKNPRPMIPAKDRSLVINLLHHADHAGQKETLRRVAKEYYWPGLRKDVANFVKTCHPCQIARQSSTINPGVGDFPVPDKRFSFIHLDIVGPLPLSHGHKYILSVYDRCSRWTEAYPLVQASSEEVCRGFMEWVSRYGLPCVAVSDQGNALVANLFQGVLDHFGVKVRFSPVYHAATNGAVERKHQDIKNSLKAALVEMGNKERDQWFRALPWVMLGRRVSLQPNLDASAAQMVLNMSPRIPGQLLGHPGPPLGNQQVRALLDQLYRQADRPPVPTSGKREFIDINDKTADVTHVYVKVDKPESLCPKFEGPYKVVDRPSRSQVTVKVGVTKEGEDRVLTYHWTSCKPAFLREGAEEGSRPMRGRKPKQSSGPERSLDNTGETQQALAPNIQDGGQNKQTVERGEIQTAVRDKPSPEPVYDTLSGNAPHPDYVKKGPVITTAMFNKWTPDLFGIPPNQVRPIRSTRNTNPKYV